MLEVNWSEYQTHSDLLAEMIYRDDLKFTHVFAILRGGFFVANVVAERLGIPLSYISVSSYTPENQQSILKLNGFIVIDPEKFYDNKRASRILIVDDLADSGETFKHVTKFFSVPNIEFIKTAAIFKKSKSAFEPDYFVEVVDSQEWIVQPFEK